jgi:probable F420-dependent oxidoreductase
MDLGVTLPVSGPFATPESIVRVAREAESLGYAAVWTYERLLYPIGDVAQPGGPPRPLPEVYVSTYEPIETLTYVAAATTRIRLGTSVVNAPFHVPVVLARRFATLDRLSGGRAIAGLGQGWMEQEFATANASRRLRGAGVEEFVAAMRAAWGPDPATFEGRHYRVPTSRINPKPLQPGGVPVLLGSLAPAAVERAARIADGLNPLAFSLEQLTGTVAAFLRAAERHGRDPSALRVIVRANVPITAGPRPADRRPFLGGSPAQIAEDLARVERLGVEQVLFSDLASRTLDQHLERLAELRAATGAG